MYETENKIERAIAVSVVIKQTDLEIAMEHLDELEFLADTAGAFVVEKIYQELEKPHVATFVGKGKLEEIRQEVEDNDINLVIFDDDLSPVQLRNLEKALNVKVMDRSGIILDIFAKRAKSQEAITQVELAQLQYMMPRLTRMWTHLSKQFGGIGTKGPGETQIETDRRLLKTRISHLKKKLLEIDKQKETQRKSRQSMPRFALVGYTNAGKSTLMRLISADNTVYVEDKLFATLDTTVRKFDLPGGEKALLSDTVGFIRKLPTHLIASFRSTLAEASEADILLHVVDISHEHFEDQIEVVNRTLEELKISEKRTILVFNKIDLLEDQEEIIFIEREYDNSVFISAEKGINISGLMDKMQEEYEKTSKKLDIMLPYENMNLVNLIFNNSEILEQKELDAGIQFKLRIQDDKYNYFKNTFERFLTNGERHNN